MVLTDVLVEIKVGVWEDLTFCSLTWSAKILGIDNRRACTNGRFRNCKCIYLWYNYCDGVDLLNSNSDD